MPATVTLELEGGDPSRVKPKHLRAYVNRLVERGWTLGQHEGGIPAPSDTSGRITTKPFAIHPSYDPGRSRIIVKIQLFDDRLAEPFTSYALRSGSVRLGSQFLTVLDVRTELVSWGDLAAGTGRDGDYIFRFLTPAIFREGDCPLPFPLPATVFHRLGVIWNTFTPPALSVPVDFSRMDLFTVDLDVHTELAPHERTTYVGLLGEARYSAYRVDRTTREVLETLGRFAQISGVGSFTAAGFGVTDFTLADRLLPPCRVRRRDAGGHRR